MFCVNEALPRLSWLMKDSFSSSSRLSSPGFKQSQTSYFGAEGLRSALAHTPHPGNLGPIGRGAHQ